MATLIQSKQIQGVVTASVITGDFAVNAGSVNLSGASGVSGSFSGSFIGDGSGLTGIHQNLDFNSVSKILTISSGNSVDLSSLGGGGGGGGSSIWTTGSDFYKVSSDLQVTGSFSATSLTGSIDYSNLTNLPSGIFSGSLIAGNNITITSGSGNITITSSGGGSVPAGTVSGSEQITFSGISNIPSGLLSSSAQLTDGSNIVSGSVLRTLDGTGVVSGSVLRTLDGTDVVSGSVIRTFDGTGILSGSKTDISSLNTYTSSADSRLSSIEAATGSYLTSETDSQTLSISGDQLTISTGNTVTIPTGSSLPSGVISGSAQLTTEFDTRYINTSGDGIISGSVLRTLDGTGVISGSVLRTLDGTGVISGSILSQLPSGVISGSTQITDGSGILSGSLVSQLPSGLVSGSYSSSVDSRILTEKSRIDNILSGANADYDQFVEIVELVNSTDTTNDTAFANHYTSSRQRDTALELFTSSIDTTIKTKLNTEDVLSGSIESLLPGGVVSGSTQITDGSGILSGSVLRTLDGTGVLSGSHTDISSLNTYTSSADSRLASIEAATGSYLTSETDSQTLSISGDQLTISTGNTVTIPTGSSLPSGTVSSSVQLTTEFDTRYLNTDGDGVVSGSVLRNLDGTGVISGSVLRTLDGTGVVSGSVLRTLDGTTVLSGSLLPGTNITINSGSGNYIISSSGGSTDFDGNRVISQDKLPAFFTSSFNPGTSGSVTDFLNAIFYPNSAPSITTGNQTISEYTTNGSTIVTVSGTDPEGQSLTFGTSSAYSDDLVRVASNGVMTLNSLPTSASFNTDSVSGVHGHKVEVTATDTFNTTVTKDIYIIVTPNEAPKFRENSVSGNIITSVTANLNESSADDTLVKRVFFTDVESDTITITTSSIDNNHFDIDIQSTYVDIKQNTGSLDYEQQTTYTFSITASDEHYEDGNDLDSRTFLPITVNVTDNLVPVVNSQVVGSLNENSSNGASVGSISATDSEGDGISFVTFDLHKLLLDGSTVSSGSYGGTSQLTDPHENPFQMDSSGNVTRKTGVLLNSDLINSYQYRVQVRDNYNAQISSASVATINITDDTPATLSDNWSAGPYIKESEENGTTIKTTNYGSTTADYNSNQSGTWTSSNSEISINSSGNLSLGFHVSGSAKQSGQSLDSTITFTNTFGTTTTDSLSVVILPNHFPSASFTNQTSNLNTNLAVTNSNLVLVAITDTEGDTPYSASLSGTDASKLNINYTNGTSSSLYIRANENLSAGTLNYNLRVTDSYSESSDYTGKTITIAAADTGTLGGDTTSYIIESGKSGEAIRDASGFGAGNQSQMTVSYSPDYGSQAVQGSSWSSSNSAIAINTSGQLSLASHISGSSTGSGDTIVSTIGFEDQYGNVGSGNVTVNVFANNHPSASFTQNTSIYNENQMVSGSLVESFTITDTEADVPYGISLSGTDASKIDIVPQNSNTSSVQLKTKEDLAGGSYAYTVSVSDGYQVSEYDRTVSIASANLGSMSENGTFYIIESALNNDFIFTNSNGRTGTQGEVSVSYSPNYGSQSATNFASSNALIAIDSSNGKLKAGGNISGSGNTNGETITSTISWNDQYGNNGSDSITVNVAQNNAPTVSSTSTSNLNTNQATASAQILNLVVSDTESDSIPNSGLSFSGFNSTHFTPSISTPSMKLLVNNTSVPAGTYGYTASIQDVHGFSTTTVENTFTIAQASTGSLGGDTAIYIIESATTGSVFRDQTGFNQGNAAQLSVSYSPNYGSAVVQSYTSSRQGISVDSSGNLTAGYDFSGSVTSTDYTSTALTSDSTNSTLYGKSLHVNGIKVVQGAATGSQSAVPDLFTEKVAQVVKLMITGSGADIDDVAQANMIGTLKGETGTWHQNLPTAQRVLRGAGGDYSPNPLQDSNYSSYPGLQNFQDSHSTKDMIWYLNSTASSGSGDADITEVVEHLMHTIHSYGVRGGVEGSVNGLSWIPGMDSDWKTRELFLAFKQAVDNSVFSLTGYGDEDYNTEDTFELAVIEYLYLLNFNMWEYSSLWDGGSLSPEWNDNSRTPSGIQTNNPLGYALYNKYIKPVLTKPSLSSLRSIFQDGDVGNPAIAGSSGYTPEVGSGLISNIKFRDQYDNIGSGSVTATVFGNSSPVANFTQTSGYESDNATSGSDAGALVVTDTESNSPFTITLAGTDGGKFDVSGTSSPFEIQPTGSLDAGTYTINITITDSYSESVTLTGETITVDASANNGKVYVYDVGFNNATYNTALGIQSEDSSTPPVATPFSGIGFVEKIINGDVLGDSSFTYSYGSTITSNKLAEASGSNVHDVLRTMGTSGVITRNSSKHFAILMPSGSSMTGFPTSTTNGYGGSTAGQYVLEVGTDGTTIDGTNTIETSEINQITLGTSHLGFTKWFIVGSTGQLASSTNFNLGLNPSSGSGGA